MRERVHVDPEAHKLADQYFGAYIRELSRRKQEIAQHTRDLVKQGIYPSAKKVGKPMGRNGFDGSENHVRYTVMHAYGGTEGIIQAWKKKYYRAMTKTGLMFGEEIIN